MNKKLLCIFGGLVVLAYLSACSYVWVHQKHLIFMPKREISKAPADINLPFEDLYLHVPTSDGRTELMHCWWIPANDTQERYLIYLHGGALNIGANVHHARRFKELGFSVLLISYRGYGKSEGNFPTEAQVYADAETAWNYLVKQKRIKPEDIFIYGHSLGGAVAINLAISHPNAKGLIVESTFTSIADMGRQNKLYNLLPVDFIIHQRFDSISKIDQLQIPVLFLHGTADDFVPFTMSQRLYDQASSTKLLKLIPGGAHRNSAVVGREEFLNAVRELVELALKEV
jgi:alpha-beta hydrolase superfamily lysophospholipase